MSYMSENISTQYVRALLSEGLYSLENFAECTQAEVLAIPNIGKVTLQKLLDNGVEFLDS